MVRTRYLEEITDPITGEVKVIAADSEEELEVLVAAYLDSAYPESDLAD
jgi:hypothetical protein